VLESAGTRFIACPPPEEQRLTLLNEVWKIVTRCDDLPMYISCATAWLELLLRHYSEREVTILLRDVVRHVDAASAIALAAGTSQPMQRQENEGAMKKLEHLVSLLVEVTS